MALETNTSPRSRLTAQPRRSGSAFIVPTRNRPQELLACVRGILEQTVLPKEVCIVDSSDAARSRDVIEALCDGAGVSLRYVHPAPRGSSVQRNIGIDTTQGQVPPPAVTEEQPTGQPADARVRREPHLPSPEEHAAGPQAPDRAVVGIRGSVLPSRRSRGSRTGTGPRDRFRRRAHGPASGEGLVRPRNGRARPTELKPSPPSPDDLPPKRPAPG